MLSNIDPLHVLKLVWHVLIQCILQMARHTFPLVEAFTAWPLLSGRNRCWTVDLEVYKGRALLLLFLIRAYLITKKTARRSTLWLTKRLYRISSMFIALSCNYCATQQISSWNIIGHMTEKNIPNFLDVTVFGVSVDWGWFSPQLVRLKGTMDLLSPQTCLLCYRQPKAV